MEIDEYLMMEKNEHLLIELIVLFSLVQQRSGEREEDLFIYIHLSQSAASKRIKEICEKFCDARVFMVYEVVLSICGIEDFGNYHD